MAQHHVHDASTNRPRPQMPDLGTLLRTRRWNELRLFQEDVAAAAHLSPGQLSHIESGRGRTSEPVLRSLATVLDLDPGELIAEARRTGALVSWRTRANRGDAPTGDRPPQRARTAVPRPQPASPWVTADEAAAIIGCSASVVRALVRRGTLAPAIRTNVGGRGHARWMIDAAAVTAYVPRNDGRDFPRGPRTTPPAGYQSIADFVEETGIPVATLHRRIAAGEITSIKVGNRRWIKRLA